MIKAIRYTFAAICLAASVGCLALWSRSETVVDMAYGNLGRNVAVHLSSRLGRCGIGFCNLTVFNGWTHTSKLLGPDSNNENQPRFQLSTTVVQPYRTFYHCTFPLWYPALVFALAAVATIRIGRFTLRAALVGMSVVAALLGMVVAL